MIAAFINCTTVAFGKGLLISLFPPQPNRQPQPVPIGAFALPILAGLGALLLKPLTNLNTVPVAWGLMSISPTMAICGLMNKYPYIISVTCAQAPLIITATLTARK